MIRRRTYRLTLVELLVTQDNYVSLLHLKFIFTPAALIAFHIKNTDAYARKSSEAEDRQVASIDSQLNELRKLAAERNLEVIDELTESKSAKESGRPVFDKMIERIKKGEAIRCGECGSMITAEDKIKNQKNGNVHMYTYYHCTKRTKKDFSQKTIEVKILEQQITDYLSRISIPETFIQFALDVLQSNKSNDEDNRDKMITTYKNELVLIAKKLDKLIEMNIAENISVEEFNRKRSEYKSREQELKMIIDELQNNSEEKVMTSVKDLLMFGAVAVEAFQNSNDQEKRIILSALGSNLLIKDKKLKIEFEKPLSLLEDVACSLKGKRAKKDRLEPVHVHKKKRTYSNKKAISPVMLREQDSNLQPFG